MRSDHPENCDVMYELTFNGNILPLISTTEVSREELIREGFPFCQSTNVSVAPHISAHDVIRNLTKTTSYLAIPSKKDYTIFNQLIATACMYIPEIYRLFWS